MLVTHLGSAEKFTKLSKKKCMMVIDGYIFHIFRDIQCPRTLLANINTLIENMYYDQ